MLWSQLVITRIFSCLVGKYNTFSQSFCKSQQSKKKLWNHCLKSSCGMNESILCHSCIRDHPFKTSACLRGGGVKNLPNLLTDSSKKPPTVGGLGSKIGKEFALMEKNKFRISTPRNLTSGNQTFSSETLYFIVF